MTSFKQLAALVAMLLSISMHAQEKITAKQVSTQSVTLSNIFKKYALYEINTVHLNKYMKQAGQGNIQLELNLPGFASFPMNLQAHDILSNNYKLVVGTPQGRQEFPKPACITYQGVITNQASSNVYLTITNDLVYGMLNGSSQSWFIEPLQYFDKQANGNVYVVYDIKDVLPRKDISCGVNEIQTRQITNNATARVEGTATGNCKMTGVAIASDNAMLLRYGSPDRVAEHNISVMNVMSGIYRKNLPASNYLEFKVNGQYVSTSLANNALSPVIDTNSGSDLLYNFMEWGNAGNFGFPYDIGVYWTAKDMIYLGYINIAGLAYLSSVCTSFKYQLLVDMSNLSGAQLGSLAAHESGHNFGAEHDNPADPYVMNPGLNDPPNTTFSSASINAITTYLNGSADCLSACDATMPIVQFSTSVPNICAGNSIIFTNNSVGQVSNVSWTFQDGTPATSDNDSETVTFSTPGIKNITLTATNDKGTNTLAKTVFVGAPLNGTGCRTTGTGGAGYGGILTFSLQGASYDARLVTAGPVYKDLTCSRAALLQPNTTYPVTTIIGLYDPPAYFYPSNLQLFIDYNNDGDFLDAGENVHTSNASHNGIYNFSFTTPATVPVMDTYLRMRVVAMPSTVTSTNGCAIPPNSHVLDFAVYFNTDVNNNGAQVLVYPNPVLRSTRLQIKKATNELSVIEIFNSMGQKVYVKRMMGTLYNTNIDIPANWSTGIYIIRITDNKQSWSGSVLIK